MSRWAAQNPMKVLAAQAVWERLLSVVRWIMKHSGEPVYLRQMDVPGVDTGFVEMRLGMLCDLLDFCLAPSQGTRDRP